MRFTLTTVADGSRRAPCRPRWAHMPVKLYVSAYIRLRRVCGGDNDVSRSSHASHIKSSTSRDQRPHASRVSAYIAAKYLPTVVCRQQSALDRSTSSWSFYRLSIYHQKSRHRFIRVIKLVRYISIFHKIRENLPLKSVASCCRKAFGTQTCDNNERRKITVGTRPVPM